MIAVAVVIVIVVAGFLLLRGSGSPEQNLTGEQAATPSSVQESNESSQNESTNEIAAEMNTITYKDGKFSPETLSVDSGDSITVVNNSGEVIQFQSNPHPAHTDEDELNVGTIAPGETRTFVVTKKGTWGFHNHLESSQGGTIIVK